MLLALGYRADGLYIGLGIDGYSDASLANACQLAQSKRATLVEIDLRQEFGYTIPMAADTTGRVPCSACGLSKRHLFDRAAVERGYAAVAAGHNLDDEAAVLFGNVLRWKIEFLRRAAPLLQADGDTADHDAHGDVLGRCRSCDVPTDNEVCAFCRLVDRVTVR